MKRWGKLAAILAAALLLSGCGRLAVTMGLNTRLLAVCGSSRLTLPQFGFLFLEVQNRYNAYYLGLGQTGFWETEVQGESFSDYVLDTEVRDEISTLLLLTEMAGEEHLALDAGEKEACRLAASDYLMGLSAEERAFTNGSEADLIALYEKYALAKKMIDHLSLSGEGEISDNDKRVILLQVICCDTLSAAQAAKARVEGGESFAAVAEEVSVLPLIDYQVHRGSLNPLLEEQAFLMGDGEISDVIETEEAFYLLKCVNDFEEGLSRANEQTTLARIRFAQWAPEVIAYTKKHAVAISPGIWKHLSFGETSAFTTTDLFSTLERYLP